VEIKVVAKHGDLSPSIQETMRQKVSKLPRFFERTTGIQVVADMRHNSSPKVEVIVSAEETSDFFASDTGTNVIAALDRVINKIEQQMRKHKNKLTEHRGRDRTQPEAAGE
jgi:putative sigma-54 modulation protein